ncbi:hypothetical protein CRM22_001191 [Opisthorchis felineus]|uniref:Uncharacterized protein n=1 Tax=Opisthorchis felineus TaxID=147828 RepID=A0A4S2MBQ3_OPIFE|nr:hypothetical protein CRM22_001191 [Opisthorchis felineus]
MCASSIVPIPQCILNNWPQQSHEVHVKTFSGKVNATQKSGAVSKYLKQSKLKLTKEITTFLEWILEEQHGYLRSLIIRITFLCLSSCNQGVVVWNTSGTHKLTSIEAQAVETLRRIGESVLRKDHQQIHFPLRQNHAKPGIFYESPVYAQLNNNAYSAQSDEELSSGNELALRFVCSPELDEFYHPVVVSRRKRRSPEYQRRPMVSHTRRPVRTNAIREPMRKCGSRLSQTKTVGTGYLTQTPSDQTRLYQHSPSTAILFCSEDESNSSMFKSYQVVDRNMSQNLPEDCVARPPSPYQDITEDETVYSGSSLPHADMLQYNAKWGSDSRIHESDSYQPYSVPMSFPTTAANYENNSDQLRSTEKFTIHGKLGHPRSRLQTNHRPIPGYSVGDGKLIGLLERVDAVEFCGTRHTSRLLNWPISRTPSPITSCNDESHEVERSRHATEHTGFMVYALRSLCTIRSPIATRITSSTRYRVEQFQTVWWDQLKSGMLDEDALDKVNPDISSPIVETEVLLLTQPEEATHQCLNPATDTYAKEMFAKDHLISEGITSPQVVNLSVHEDNDDCQNIVQPAIKSLNKESPTKKEISRRKFRRRVKITLHQDPISAGAETPSLVVRLRINPRADTQSVLASVQPEKIRQQTDSRKLAKLRNALQKGRPASVGDTRTQKELDPWVPVGCMQRTINFGEDASLDDREKFSGMAECLITSLSSLSIPISEVDSLDSSFSWSLPEPIPQRRKCRKKSSRVADTVIVEVMSDEDVVSEDESRYKEANDHTNSEMYCLGCATVPNRLECSKELYEPPKTTTTYSKTPRVKYEVISTHHDQEAGEHILDRQPGTDSVLLQPIPTPRSSRERCIHYHIEKNHFTSKLKSIMVPVNTTTCRMRASSVVNERSFNVNELVDEPRYERLFRTQSVPDPSFLRESSRIKLESKPRKSVKTDQTSSDTTARSSSNVQLIKRNEVVYQGTVSHFRIDRGEPNAQTDKGIMSPQGRPYKRVGQNATKFERAVSRRVSSTHTGVGDTRQETKRNSANLLQVSSPGLVSKTSRAMGTAIGGSQVPRTRIVSSVTKDDGILETAAATSIKNNLISKPFTRSVYTRGFSLRKRPAFRSGELTISEFEDMCQRNHGKHTATTVTARSKFGLATRNQSGLNSLAAAVIKGKYSGPKSGNTGRQMRLNFCMSRTRSSDISQESVEPTRNATKAALAIPPKKSLALKTRGAQKVSSESIDTLRKSPLDSRSNSNTEYSVVTMSEDCQKKPRDISWIKDYRVHQEYSALVRLEDNPNPNELNQLTQLLHPLTSDIILRPYRMVAPLMAISHRTEASPQMQRVDKHAYGELDLNSNLIQDVLLFSHLERISHGSEVLLRWKLCDENSHYATQAYEGVAVMRLNSGYLVAPQYTIALKSEKRLGLFVDFTINYVGKWWDPEYITLPVTGMIGQMAKIHQVETSQDYVSPMATLIVPHWAGDMELQSEERFANIERVTYGAAIGFTHFRIPRTVRRNHSLRYLADANRVVGRQCSSTNETGTGKHVIRPLRYLGKMVKAVFRAKQSRYQSRCRTLAIKEERSVPAPTSQAIWSIKEHRYKVSWKNVVLDEVEYSASILSPIKLTAKPNVGANTFSSGMVGSNEVLSYKSTFIRQQQTCVPLAYKGEHSFIVCKVGNRRNLPLASGRPYRPQSCEETTTMDHQFCDIFRRPVTRKSDSLKREARKNQRLQGYGWKGSQFPSNIHMEQAWWDQFQTKPLTSHIEVTVLQPSPSIYLDIDGSVTGTTTTTKQSVVERLESDCAKMSREKTCATPKENYISPSGDVEKASENNQGEIIPTNKHSHSSTETQARRRTASTGSVSMESSVEISISITVTSSGSSESLSYTSEEESSETSSPVFGTSSQTGEIGVDSSQSDQRSTCTKDEPVEHELHRNEVAKYPRAANASRENHIADNSRRPTCVEPEPRFTTAGIQKQPRMNSRASFNLHRDISGTNGTATNLSKMPVLKESWTESGDKQPTVVHDESKSKTITYVEIDVVGRPDRGNYWPGTNTDPSTSFDLPPVFLSCCYMQNNRRENK